MPTTAARARPDLRTLDEIRAIFGLSEHELADIFGVRRQSVAEWRAKGVPQTRRATLDHTVGLARALHREVIPEHIPQIVRTPDAWLDERSILQTLAHGDGVERVYGYLHRLFSYSP